MAALRVLFPEKLDEQSGAAGDQGQTENAFLQLFAYGPPQRIKDKGSTTSPRRGSEADRRASQLGGDEV
jgi:hypothetical protein